MSDMPDRFKENIPPLEVVSVDINPALEKDLAYAKKRIDELVKVVEEQRIEIRVLTRLIASPYRD